MGHRVAVEQEFTQLDEISLLDGQMLALGDEVFHGVLLLIARAHDNPAFVLVVLTELHNAVCLAHDGVILGHPGLE